jgi:hypothetical protein
VTVWYWLSAIDRWCSHQWFTHMLLNTILLNKRYISILLAHTYIQDNDIIHTPYRQDREFFHLQVHRSTQRPDRGRGGNARLTLNIANTAYPLSLIRYHTVALKFQQNRFLCSNFTSAKAIWNECMTHTGYCKGGRDRDAQADRPGPQAQVLSAVFSLLFAFYCLLFALCSPPVGSFCLLPAGWY